MSEATLGWLGGRMRRRVKTLHLEHEEDDVTRHGSVQGQKVTRQPVELVER